MGQVDLHVHSTCSDGTYTPSELVAYGLEKNLVAMALTDHDTIKGIDEALLAAKDKPIEIVPGIEYSTNYENKDVHIVGLFIDYKSKDFLHSLEQFMQTRLERNIRLCANLADAGIDISVEALDEMFPDTVVTRAHYAKYLLTKGYVKSKDEAFDRYLGDHTRYFVPRCNITPQDVIEVTKKAGGIPILAHPPLYGLGKDRLDKLVSDLTDVGLMGIECKYCTYSSSDEREMKELATKYHLMRSGGSDFHGSNKANLDLGVGYGHLYVPEHYYFDLKELSEKKE